MPDEETEVDPGLAMRMMAQGWGEEGSTASGEAIVQRARKVSTLDSAASESVQTMPWAGRRTRAGVVAIAAGALVASVVGVVTIARRPPPLVKAAQTMAPQAAAAAVPVRAPAAPIRTPEIVVTPLDPHELKVRLAVDSHPHGASVWRGGVAVGRTPFTEEMAPSEKEIVYTLKLAGYVDGEARFDGGGEQTIDLVRKHAR
jgi:hypothetical protein